jgi:uncharacterized membrane protein HdeD (DUF308 family)
METISDQLKLVARYWRGLVITGLFLIIAGVAIFLKPEESYLTLNFLFSMVLIIGGISNTFLGSVGRKKDKGGWTLTAGIFEILIGIFLLIFSFASKITIPFVLGFWIMFRAVYMMGTALDLKKMKLSGWAWILTGGFVNMVLAFLVLYNPSRGVISIRLIYTVIFIVAGILNLVLALKIKYIKSTAQKYGEGYMFK